MTTLRNTAFVVLLVIGFFPARISSQGEKQLPSSPRLSALQKELEAGNVIALENFWQEVGKQGAPLIESITNDDGYSLITFLWRAREATKNVGVFGGIAGIELSYNRMTRLRDTDIWFRTYRARNDARFAYKLSVNDPLDSPNQPRPGDERIKELRSATLRADPLNPRGVMGASIVELPGAPPQPWSVKHTDVPAGSVEWKKLKSARLNNERNIGIYLPPGYQPKNQPYGLLIVFDGDFYFSDFPLPTILDNLQAKKLLAPFVAVAVNNPTDTSRNVELPCNDDFAEFLAKELIPWVRQNYQVTTDPQRTIAVGASYGGLAASFAAFRHPEIFGNVISQSGAYWWKPDFQNPKNDGESEWLTGRFVTSPRLPVHFYLDVGLLERTSGGLQGDGPSMVVANRHLRDVLRAKGYVVHYREFYGGHEYLNWRGMLPDALLSLAGNDKKETR